MFTSIKKFFVEVLIAVGIISSPVALPPQNVPINEASVTMQEIVESLDTEIESKTPSEATESTIKPDINQNNSEATPVSRISPETIVNESTEVVKPISGQCGGSHGKNVIQEPKENLCVQGTSSSLTKETNSYKWNCLGVNGGRDSMSCQAPIISDGICGNLSNTIVPEKYDQTKLCSIGQYSNLKNIGTQLSWNCLGVNGGKNNTCYATKVITETNVQVPTKQTVNGICGYANNQTHFSLPTSGLCSSGASNSLKINSLGTKYTWSCLGLEGGTSAQCSSFAETIPSECIIGGVRSSVCLSKVQ